MRLAVSEPGGYSLLWASVFAMTPKIMGLDLSLTSTGISIDGETFVIASKERGPARLIEISKTVVSLALTKRVELVVIEGYSFASRNSQAHSIGELGGVVRAQLYANDVPYIEVPPTCRAKFATGRGNASKNDVISAISAKTGIIWSGSGSDDKCDAWILEEMALVHYGMGKYEWPSASISSLEKIDWNPIKQGEPA
jgi:Holliday junction resolvasome RuvABC endonuclease subunit